MPAGGVGGGRLHRGCGKAGAAAGAPRPARVQQAGAAREGRGGAGRRGGSRARVGQGRSLPAGPAAAARGAGGEGAAGKREGAGPGRSCPGRPRVAGGAAGLVPATGRARRKRRALALAAGGVAAGSRTTRRRKDELSSAAAFRRDRPCRPPAGRGVSAAARGGRGRKTFSWVFQVCAFAYFFFSPPLVTLVDCIKAVPSRGLALSL